MTKLSKLKTKFLSDPLNRVAYEDLELEFYLARKLIAARVDAGLLQSEVAQRMGTKQSEVSRIESARQNITISKLADYADAVGTKLDITLEPIRPAS